MITPDAGLSRERLRDALNFHFKPILSYFDNQDITDIKVNPNGNVYAKHIDGKNEKLYTSIRPESISAVAHLLASTTQNDISDDYPSVQAVYPDPPYRIHIILPPASDKPCLVIRRFNNTILPLSEFEKKGSCTHEQAEKMKEFIALKKNIIVSGETGSGKTTLINALINEINIEERLFIIEDTKELRWSSEHEDVTSVLTGQHYSTSDAVKDSLRFVPDRIIIGEVRDGAALDMLEAWNTGHPGGLCTLHANSASTVKERLSSLVRRVSTDGQKDVIDTALDVVIQITLCKDGVRRISEIKEFYKEK